MQLFQSISTRFLIICAILRRFVPHLERLLIFHTQEVTGSSPAVSTKSHLIWGGIFLLAERRKPLIQHGFQVYTLTALMRLSNRSAPTFL